MVKREPETRMGGQWVVNGDAAGAWKSPRCRRFRAGGQRVVKQASSAATKGLPQRLVILAGFDLQTVRLACLADGLHPHETVRLGEVPLHSGRRSFLLLLRSCCASFFCCSMRGARLALLLTPVFLPLFLSAFPSWSTVPTAIKTAQRGSLYAVGRIRQDRTPWAEWGIQSKE